MSEVFVYVAPILMKGINNVINKKCNKAIENCKTETISKFSQA